MRTRAPEHGRILGGDVRAVARRAPCTERIEAAIVDDHLAVRDGLPLLLAPEDIHVVARAPARPDAVERLLAAGLPALALVGARGRAGLELAGRVAGQSNVLLLADAPGAVERGDALHAGAAGVIWKGSALEDWVRAIRTVAAGGVWLDGAAPAFARGPGPLSLRERGVLVEIARGSSTEQIAATLHVSPHTVRTHTRNIQRKLGARTRAHAVALALAAAAIDP